MSEERFTAPEQKKTEEKPVEAQKEQEKARAEHKPEAEVVKGAGRTAEKKKVGEKEEEEKPVLERVYTFNLREAYKKPYYKRANYAVRLLRKLVVRHLKSEDVKIDPALAEFVRASGQPKPRVKVKAAKFEGGTVKVQLA